MGLSEENMMRKFHRVGIILLASFLQLAYLRSAVTASENPIVVNNTNCDVNGDTSGPDALRRDPGPDGISLVEAILAANAVPGPHTIQFDPTLRGARIVLTTQLPPLMQSDVLIRGHIDGAGIPDITVDGSGGPLDICFVITASRVTITGIAIQNFKSAGISVVSGTPDGAPMTIQGTRLIHNKISGCRSGISVVNSGNNCSIHDTEIAENNLSVNTFTGVDIHAASGAVPISGSSISNTWIVGNSIINIGGNLGMFITATVSPASSGNAVTGLLISNNTLQGHINSSLLVGAGNQSGSQDNRFEDVTITGNSIEGSPVTVEVVGATSGSLRNTVSGMRITQNNLRGGGIQVVAAYGETEPGTEPTYENQIQDLRIESNIISNAQDHGIFLNAGSSGAFGNSLQRIFVENNLITGSGGGGLNIIGGFDNAPNNSIDEIHVTGNTFVGNGWKESWGGAILANANNQSQGNSISDLQVINTIFWNNNGNDDCLGTDPPSSVQNSILNNNSFTGRDGNFYLSPEFVDLDNNDYRLTKTSPAIDSGSQDLGELAATDIRGYPRVIDGNLDGLAVPDIGAYEYSPPDDLTGRSILPQVPVLDGGAGMASTFGSTGLLQVGYALADISSANPPFSVAVISLIQNGVVVSETGVPASPPTTAARIFIDYRSSVAAIPARISAGTIDIDTGIAVVNYGSASANVTYTLRDINGISLSSGHGTLASGSHFAKFIDQLGDVAPDFVLPANFQIATQFASLEISSDQPLSILALRMTTNQRNEVLYTTTPIADLTQPLTSNAVYFPQLADGGGITTSLVLLNTSNGIETGTLQILDDNGNPFVVNQVGGTSGSTFRYSIPNGGVFRFQTDGSPADTKAGWVQLTPDTGTSTPIGAGVYSYNPEDVLVTESGIPAAHSTTHARIYVDLSGGHDTGLAIANLSNTNASITITAFQSDGVTGIGTSQGPLQLAGGGHDAQFADQFIANLPAGFTGVLDIASTTPFAALTIRSLYNERHDFLVTTFPIADVNQAAPSPIVFPQIADGGGLVTQFIFLSPGGASSTTLSFYAEDGTYLAVGK